MPTPEAAAAAAGNLGRRSRLTLLFLLNNKWTFRAISGFRHFASKQSKRGRNIFKYIFFFLLLNQWRKQNMCQFSDHAFKFPIRSDFWIRFISFRTVALVHCQTLPTARLYFRSRLTYCSPWRCSCSSAQWVVSSWWQTPPGSPRATPAGPWLSRSFQGKGLMSCSRNLDKRANQRRLRLAHVWLRQS